MKQSKGLDILLGLFGLVTGIMLLNWIAQSLHLPWSLDLTGARNTLFGQRSSNITGLKRPGVQTPDPMTELPSVGHSNPFSWVITFASHLIIVLIIAWLLIGVIIWYRKSGAHTIKSFIDFLVFRWPQITVGRILKRFSLVQDAWERHFLSHASIAGHNTHTQYSNSKVLRHIEQILFAAMKGSNIDVEEIVGIDKEKRSVAKVALVVAWEENGWCIRLNWTEGFQLSVFTKWREWAPEMAVITLRHYGYPAEKAHIDTYGFLHIQIEQAKPELKLEENMPAAEPLELVVEKNLVHQPNINNQDAGSLREGGPPLALLKPGKGAIGRPNEGKMAIKAMEEAMATFNLQGNVFIRGIGPTLIALGIVPKRGISPKTILSRTDDLRMAAKGNLKGLLLEGADTEIRALVTRKQREIVALRNLLETSPSESFDEDIIPLAFPAGVDLAGNPIWVSLTKMPHLLIAGTTGSGKSVFSHSLLTGLTFRYSPDQLKLFLIDAKGTEMAFYKDLPHLLSPPISDAKMALNAVNYAINEMDNRNEIFQKEGIRDFEGYIRKGNLLPRIVIFLDELFDLFVGAGDLRDELENNLTRIAQKARSAGIHLVAATQKPTVEAIPSLLKGNIPSRLAFSVSSMAESMVILDQAGAEKLIGNGDGYLRVNGRQKERIQAPYIDDVTELEGISKWWQSNGRNTKKTNTLMNQDSSSGPYNALEEVTSESLEQKKKNKIVTQNSSPVIDQHKLTLVPKKPTYEDNDEELPPLFIRTMNGIPDKLSPLGMNDVLRMNKVAQNVVQVCPVGAIIEKEQLAKAFNVEFDYATIAVKQMIALGFIKKFEDDLVLVQRWRSGINSNNVK